MSTVNERIKYFKCFPSNILIQMFLFEIFVWMFSKFVSYFKFFLQVTMNIGKIKSFQYNFTLLKFKYCFHKNFYNGSRLLFTELHKEIDFCAIYIE